jgi:hypothetical protein
MWGRLGPRFALEAGFLILLAVGAGLADLEWEAIVAVMAGGWVLVSIIEVIASRRPPWVPAPLERTPSAEEAAAPPPEPAPLPAPPALEETQEVAAPDEERRRRWIPWRRRSEPEPSVDDKEEQAVGVAEERAE